jgi:hypothetical protein
MEYCYRDYIELNPDIAHLNEADAKAHWIKEGFPAMRLCNKRQLHVICEFGAEILLYAPYYYYLYTKGLLFHNKITTYKGMKNFYYFIKPENIIEKDEFRKYVYRARRPFLVNNNEHVHRFDMRCWLPPPYKLQFQNTKFVYDKPLLIIHNKYNVEWKIRPFNYFSVELLDTIFSTLKDKYTIVYIRPTTRINLAAYAFSIDKNDMIEGLKDYELIESKYKDSVILFDDLLMKADSNYNRLKLELFAMCDNYITVQGGNAHMISFFYKKLLVLHKRGSELAAGAYTGWYSDTQPGSDKILHVSETEASIISSLSIF